MSCSRVRRELLELFALGEELGSRSGPHLAHLESCADCRQEVGIDRELVETLRRALRERVDDRAPSESSWGLVRRRTVDRPPRTIRVPHWGGIASAAAAGIMMLAVATAPQARLFPGTQSPDFVASSARRSVPPVEDTTGWQPAQSSHRAPQGVPVDDVGVIPDDPLIAGRMR